MTHMAFSQLRIACAGWSIPAASKTEFAAVDGASGLARYATRFNAGEINSTFYRPHRPQTLRKWADDVPADFRFSVKLPRTITQFARLRDAQPLLDAFLPQTDALGAKLGALLLQLPPSLAWEPTVAGAFFEEMRARWPQTPIACEPRHATWGQHEAEAQLSAFGIMRVAADPPRWPGNQLPAAAGPGYWRLHGSPRIYYSEYSEDDLRTLAAALPDAGAAWVVFDNTAGGHAVANALTLQHLLHPAQ